MSQTHAIDPAIPWMAAAPTPPPLSPPHSVEDWNRRRMEIRRQLESLLGARPDRPRPPGVKVLSRDPQAGFMRERFEFDNGAGATVRGYVLIPNGLTSKAPGILYCHWHGGQYDVGKEELFSTNATPAAPGPVLAAQGWVVAGIDAYCFGERNGGGPGGPGEKGSAGEMTAAKFQLWMGRSLWGMIVRDDQIALDYLCARPEVDAARIGVTGISMGSTRAWWLMALDDRPKTGVAVGCLTRYQDLIASGGLKHHGIYYFVPGMLNHFDTEAVVALCAPRPMLFMTGAEDHGSPASGIARIDEAVRPIYRLLGSPDRFVNRVYPGVGHVYTPEMWRETLNWFTKNL